MTLAGRLARRKSAHRCVAGASAARRAAGGALIAVMASLGATASFASSPASEPGGEATAVAEAEAAYRGFVAAINAGDYDAAAAIYGDGPGFHWIERGGVQYDSGADAAASLKSLGAGGGRIAIDLGEMHTAALGKAAALVSVHFTLRALTAAGEESFAFDGWTTVGMRNGPDGWRIVGGQTGPGMSAAASNPAPNPADWP